LARPAGRSLRPADRRLNPPSRSSTAAPTHAKEARSVYRSAAAPSTASVTAVFCSRRKAAILARVVPPKDCRLCVLLNACSARDGCINAARPKREHPSGAEAQILCVSCGTAEAVPFQSLVCATSCTSFTALQPASRSRSQAPYTWRSPASSTRRAPISAPSAWFR
jgi:hypothetical protein